ncbi:MAG: multicopper oxidase domain-containing protein [Chloroflexi bacterium]|nr:multicopper oxidase domain-containing protein [Chloroflexota bacterium]
MPGVVSRGNPLLARSFGTDFSPRVFNIVPAALPNGELQDFQTFNQAGLNPSAGQNFNAYVLRPTGVANQYNVVFDSGRLTVPSLPPGSSGQIETYPLATPVPVQTGDVIAFYGRGIPFDYFNSSPGTDIVCGPVYIAPVQGSVITVGSASFPKITQGRTYSFSASVYTTSTGLRKFVDGLPGLGPTQANNLGQYIPVAEADTTTYPGSDYYEIAVVEYEEQMHSDLPPTKLRGYVQLSTSVIPGAQIPLFNPDGSPILLPDGVTQAVGVDNPHYLGPLLSATRDRPVRILFRNLLPTGRGGDLFIPVDTTVMGAGTGPEMIDHTEPDPLNPMCSELNKPIECYTENRATLHLHGGITPWISDGTPHQWVTPANENTPYPKGVSVQNVPDMPDPGPGAITFFYTNQQSARLSFYHDHAWGITRLNVYAGEVAPYVITDDVEDGLITAGLIPNDTATIPLVIQDKTYVPSESQLSWQDPLWDMGRWGGFGQLWVPHVYVPAQNPGDSSGVNQFGRWAYGPWFWPPTNNIAYGVVPNPYYDPACDPDITWCEPATMPGTPNISMGMEAFNDTPVVNGTAYPTVTLDPKTYRFRILNGANDRFWNLSFYVADSTGTEVALNAAEVAAALDDPAGVFPTPDTAISPAGPDWIQIASEGGFLPKPAVIPAQTITWVTDPTVFNAGNVDLHSLLIAPAERADVIVDFSQYAGQTLILYNDAPAAFPARDPRYDYYTGNPDLRDTGGAPSTLPGYGPNTRTVMQIKIANVAPAPAFDLASLEAAFTHQTDGSGVFESGQHPIIVGQGAYNSAYGTTFQNNGVSAGLVQIFDTQLTFNTLAGPSLTIPFERKAIQDEMGEAFDPDYGRMSGNLGLESPFATAGQAQNLILYPYVNPASEILNGIELPVGQLEATQITTADDGTQIWKITHNGVDTHPIHFHLFDVQLINRVGWDGIIRKPEANELGWKDTVRISPLEDTIVAMRPIIPKLPFGLPDSERPLNPMMPLGSTEAFISTDANGNPIPPIVNQIVSFGWEYVWHCHILSHEEMDMMRPMSVNVSRSLADAPLLNFTGAPGSPIGLSWSDSTPVDPAIPSTWGGSNNEIGYRIERAEGIGAFQEIGTALANVTSFTDNTTVSGTVYQYRVVAYNAAGDSASVPVLVGAAIPVPDAPSNLQVSLLLSLQTRLTWTDNATTETGFVIERSDNGDPFVVIASPAADTTLYTDATVVPGHTYTYQVAAVNGSGRSGVATAGSVYIPTAPTAPSTFAATAQVTTVSTARVNLSWVDNSNDETSFVIQRASDAGFTTNLATFTRRANATTLVQTGLPRGVTYYYRILAQNAYGQSAWVNLSPPSITTP